MIEVLGVGLLDRLDLLVDEAVEVGDEGSDVLGERHVHFVNARAVIYRRVSVARKPLCISPSACQRGLAVRLLPPFDQHMLTMTSVDNLRALDGQKPPPWRPSHAGGDRCRRPAAALVDLGFAASTSAKRTLSPSDRGSKKRVGQDQRSLARTRLP